MTKVKKAEFLLTIAELKKSIELLIDFVPQGWEMPLGWNLIVEQARRAIKEKSPCKKQRSNI